MFQVGAIAIGKSRNVYEREMKSLQDQGKWKWLPTRVLENYHFRKGGTPMPVDDGEICKEKFGTIDKESSEGLQFIFQKE